MRVARRDASVSSHKRVDAVRLPRTARLLRPADFAALRAEAKRLSTRYFRIEYRARAQAPARLGMAVSRRVSKKAVVRNRIRRVIREEFRLHRANLPHVDMLLIARSAAVDGTNEQLRSELDSIWQRLASLMQAPSTPAPLKEVHAPGTMRADP